MFVNPNTVVKEGWIKFPDWMVEEDRLKCIQPNAIDITIDKAFTCMTKDSLGAKPSFFVLSETYKLMRSSIEIDPTDTDGYLKLDSGTTDILSDFYVNIPTGIAAYLIVRSTLNRNGLFVTSGLYDSGFQGHIGFAIHNDGPTAFIAPNTRVAQIIFVKAEDSGILYSGGYNHQQGTHWKDEIPTKQ